MYKILIIFVFSLMFSNYDWQDNGLPLRQGIHIEWQRTGDYGDDGTMIFAWSDTRYGGRDIYIQKVDQNGNQLWGSEGSAVVIGPGRQEDPILVTDGNGGAFVIWVDYRDEPDNGDIYAQHVNSEGVISWDIEGVVLTNVVGKQASPNMCSDGAGGAFVIWNDLSVSTLGHTYGTHLTTDENAIVAQGTGVPLIANDSDHSGVSIEVAAPGSAVMVWADDRNIDSSDIDIFTQRIDADCNTLWSTPEEGGIPLCVADGVQQYTKVTYYSDIASVVVWEDKRANPNVGDIFIQYVDMDGNILLSPEGEEICTNEANQIKPRVKADSQGAYIVWEDSRNGPGDIYVQRHVLDSGNQFESDGKGLCTAFSSQDQPRLTIDGNGGAFVVWMDERYAPFPETEIYMQHINQDGSISFADNGLAVCEAAHYQFNPLVRHDGNGNAFAVWGDARSGSIGLYAQYISTETGSTLNSDGVELYFGVDGNGLSAKSLYLGNNETLLYWEDKRLGVFADLTYGQKVYQGWEDIVTPNGIKLSDNLYQTVPLAEKTSDNIFLGFGQAYGDVVLYYQMLDDNLSMIGSSVGEPVFESFTPQNSYDIKLTSSGNLAFVFSDQRNFIDNDIYMQVFNSAGTPLLSEPVVIVDNFFIDDNVRFIESDSDGNILIIYDSGDFSGTRVYAALVNESGELVWNQRLSTEESDQFSRGVAKTDTGFFVIWKDQRSGSSDIYGQVISFDGTLQGPGSGIPITTESNDQQSPSLSYNNITDNIVVCWEDFRNGSDFDIYCSEIDESTLSVNQFELCVANGNQKTPDVFSTLDGSSLFAWEDSRNGVTSDLFYQRMNPSGSMDQIANGVVLCDADFNQLNPKIEIYDELTNSYMIYWDDMRSSGKEDLSNIYLQSVTVNSDSSECVPSGDINSDNFVNVLDIVSLVGYITGSNDFTDDQMCQGDLNNDGLINVIDIVSLVNLIIAP